MPNTQLTAMPNTHPGPGRPRKHDQTERISLTLSAADKERLDQFARSKQLNRSEAVAKLIRRIRTPS